ncbi:hypothetical protein N0A02_11645 [Paraburkholderia acidicola]|uniref:Uncharacterized protein n=1 Tax=Paraburkholderia acidicola TaxID=1912599 RepID=A0ABV1LLE8_9BURK
MKITRYVISVITALAAVSQTAVAQVNTSSGHITAVYQNWDTDQVLVSTDASPFVNPAGCPDTDSYAGSISSPDVAHLQESMLLTAFANGNPVILTIGTTCTDGRPIIWAVNMFPVGSSPAAVAKAARVPVPVR